MLFLLTKTHNRSNLHTSSKCNKQDHVCLFLQTYLSREKTLFLEGWLAQLHVGQEVLLVLQVTFPYQKSQEACNIGVLQQKDIYS